MPLQQRVNHLPMGSNSINFSGGGGGGGGSSSSNHKKIATEPAHDDGFIFSDD